MPCFFRVVHVGNLDQNGGFLDTPESGIYCRPERFHGGRQAHVGIHQRRNVFPVFPDVTGKNTVVLVIIVSTQDLPQFLFIDMNFKWSNRLDKSFMVFKYLRMK